jgi:hypothetical protein
MFSAVSRCWPSRIAVVACPAGICVTQA